MIARNPFRDLSRRLTIGRFGNDVIMRGTLGVDLYTVSKLLGHRRVTTTQIYGNIVDKKKREAVDMIPDFMQ